MILKALIRAVVRLVQNCSDTDRVVPAPLLTSSQYLPTQHLLVPVPNMSSLQRRRVLHDHLCDP